MSRHSLNVFTLVLSNILLCLALAALSQSKKPHKKSSASDTVPKSVQAEILATYQQLADAYATKA